MAASAARRQAGNLPAEVTSFVGRRREMSEARRLLGHTRLLTLAGPGGVGKTRLALFAAGQLRRVFTDGVWLVDLASVHEPELLAVTVLHTLHVHDRSARPPAAVLRDYLADKSLLLILDNCEHLLDSSAELATELLRAAPGLRILVTSREPLRVGGEQVLPVPPLSAPEVGESATADLAGYEAVALFAERAAAVVPGFTVHDGNADAVAQVVRRLDGIPLAIELAAVQLRALSLAGLRDRMDDALGALVTGTRDAPSRQRTLRAMIDSSFELCSPTERTLWARLSVFSASFDLNAAQAVCAGDGLPDDVVDLVMGLIDKSVLLREEHGRQVRYRLLETIRQYGRRRLATSGEEQRLRGAHRDFYRRLAVRMGAEWYGPRQVEWFDRMRVEHPNIRAALDFCLGEPGDVPAGLEIAIALRVYWHASMTLTEGRRWLGRLLERYRAPTPLRAAALRTASLLALYHNDLDGATPIVRESRDLARSLGDPLLVAWSALPAGFAALLREDLPSAVDSFQEALDGLRAAHDEGDALLPLMLLATSVWMAGDAERAAALGEECVSRSRSLGETWMRAWMLWTLGVVAWRQGDTRHATELEREAIQIKRTFGDRPGMGQCAEVLAWTAAAEGRYERAALLLGGVQAIWRQTGSTLYRFFDGLHHDVQEHLCGVLGRSAFETAFRCGTELTVEEVVSTAVEEKPPAPEGPAGRTPDELTRREEEIAELVAQGLTNRQIAAQLVISQRTAETHVDHILTKLGFTSRAQIASWVGARHPVPPPNAG